MGMRPRAVWRRRRRIAVVRRRMRDGRKTVRMLGRIVIVLMDWRVAAGMMRRRRSDVAYVDPRARSAADFVACEYNRS